MPVPELDDPRRWPPAIVTPFDEAARAIEAKTRADADVHDARVCAWLRDAVQAGDGERLARTFASAPTPALARHLRRLLAEIERKNPSTAAGLATTLFAIPVIVVTAQKARAAFVTLDAVLPDVAALATILRDANALSGCETFALSSSLVGVDAIDVAALPALLAANERRAAALDLAPAPIRVEGDDERVHLRFVAGAALTAPSVDPLHESTIARWGIPFAQALGRALAAPGVTLLALPRDVQRLVIAVQSGRAAQREVSAQIFASNAIRRLRASYGEPTAIISSHVAEDAPGGGELRLSLSSPFAPKAAEGFRCPLYPYETVQEVAAMLDALLSDCRVTDVRIVAGIHDDIDALTGGRLFFKDHGPLTH